VSERTYPVPVAQHGAHPLLAAGSPVTLAALRRAAFDGNQWAARVADGEEAKRQAVLASACASTPGARYFGLLDPSVDPDVHGGMLLFAVMRDDPAADLLSPYARWNGGGWDTIEQEPEGYPYVELGEDLLAEALESVTQGKAGLLLRPTAPRGWLPVPQQPHALVSAGDVVVAGETEQAPVFAVVDDFDAEAVLALFRTTPGPRIEVRQSGVWKPDPGLLGRLRSVEPPKVVRVPAETVSDVLRQVDSYDTAHTVTASGVPEDTATRGVMLCLKPSPEVAEQLALQGGELPERLHVTLAYLGDEDELSDEQHEDLDDIALRFATEAGAPLKGQVAGLGLFPDAGDGEVAYAPVDVPGVSSLATSLRDHLGERGFPVRTDHDYTPHMTVGYGMPDRPEPLAPTDVEFTDLVLARGGDEVRYPFGGKALTAATTAAEKRRSGEDQQKYKRSKGGQFASKDALGAGNDKSGRAPLTPEQKQALIDYVKNGGPRPDFATEDPKTVEKRKKAAEKAAKDSKRAADKAAREQERAAKKAAADAKRATAEAERNAKAAERDREKAAKDAEARIKAQRAAKWAAEDEASRTEDEAYDIAAAEAALTETENRRSFDEKVKADYTAMVNAGATPEEATADLAQRIAAETKRRDTYDSGARRTAETERIRRMKAASAKRQSRARETSGVIAAGPPATTAIPGDLRTYWTRGKGAARIRWGVGGDFTRCQRALSKYVKPGQVDGLCANLHKLATGTWPGRGRKH